MNSRWFCYVSLVTKPLWTLRVLVTWAAPIPHKTFFSVVVPFLSTRVPVCGVETENTGHRSFCSRRFYIYQLTET